MALAAVLETIPTITTKETETLREAGIVTPTMLWTGDTETLARRIGLSVERVKTLQENVNKASGESRNTDY